MKNTVQSENKSNPEVTDIGGINLEYAEDFY